MDLAAFLGTLPSAQPLGMTALRGVLAKHQAHYVTQAPPENALFSGVASLDDPRSGAVFWTRNWGEAVLALQGLILGPRGCPYPSEGGQFFVEVDHPRLCLSDVLALLQAAAVQHASPMQLMPGGHWQGHNVHLGEGTVVHPGVVLMDNVRIGKGCVLWPGCVIGADGFGYERVDGQVVKVPHLGGVWVGDGVEVGANSCIDRGTIGLTEIEDQVKIDNLCHIAHNAKVGEAAFVIANSMVAGGVRIGRRAWVSPSASIMQKVRVGDDSLVGMGAVVLKDVADSAVVAGVPAKVLRAPGA